MPAKKQKKARYEGSSDIRRTGNVRNFCIALYLFQEDWWVNLLVVFGPDISMVGYLAGNRMGAFSYNLFYHKGVAILLVLARKLFVSQILLITGVILFGHSSLDRIFGYGLKYMKGFGFTHLGKIGKQKIK